MKERPIIFSAPMVRAILEGRKTQTRRIIKQSRQWVDDVRVTVGEIGASRGALYVRGPVGGQCERIPCPYGGPGDRLWVREACAGADDPAHVANVLYRADGGTATRWRPSIHMPRWASRITLEITDVRAERVQDISEEDAKGEGADAQFFVNAADYIHGSRIDFDAITTHRNGFRSLWNEIHGPDSWTRNDWVWALTFKRVEVAP